MRRYAASLALVLLASPAGAEMITLWQARAVVPGASGAQTFRFGSSESAYIDHVTGGTNPSSWTAASGANVAALFAELTDGSNDPLTWHSPFLDETRAENFFFTPIQTAGALQGWSSYLTQPTVDLAGWSIDHIDLAYGFNGSEGVYRVTVFGTLPEPSGLLLFGLGAVAIQGNSRSRRRWNKRSTSPRSSGRP